MSSIERGSKIEDGGSKTLHPPSSILYPQVSGRRSVVDRAWLRWLLIGIVVAYVAMALTVMALVIVRPRTRKARAQSPTSGPAPKPSARSPRASLRHSRRAGSRPTTPFDGC